MIIAGITYTLVSVRRRLWCKPLFILLPCYYQEIIKTNSPQTRLFAANGQLLAQTYQLLNCDFPLNKFLICFGWMEQARLSDLFRFSMYWLQQGYNLQPFVYKSCAVPLNHACPLSLFFFDCL